MERYETYKDSGVEWLGEIPAGWEVRQLRMISSILNGSTPSSYIKEYWDGEIAWITPQDLGSGTKFIKYGARNITLAGYKSCGTTLAGAGSLIVSTRAPIGHVAILESSACVNQGCRLIIPESATVKSEFLYFILSIANEELKSLGKGTTFAELSKEALSSFILPITTLAEQTAIANFLDRKTAEIDALIAQKERLLELYEEEKTAIINQAVTKGLGPNAEFKDSGVEWLGEIPVGWKLKNLKYVTKQGLQNGIFKKAPDFGSGIKLINVSDIYTHNFLIDKNSLERVVCTASEVTKYEVNTGDIFFVRSSLKREGIAKTACLEGRNEPIVFECHLIKITPKDIAPQYLNYYLNSDLLRHKLISLSITTTMSTISQDAIGSLEVIIPSSKEQAAIIQYIESETARIDAKIAKTQRIIELQKEYRTALISEVVTGKIKVPELPTQEASA